MELSIEEAAALIGKSARMVRYLVKAGRIPARKEGKSWRIDRDALARYLPAGVEDARRQQVADLRTRVFAALDAAAPPGPEGVRRGFFSVRDLQCWATLVKGVQCAEDAGLGGPAAALRAAASALVEGTHQFHPQTKIGRYVDARGSICAAIADALLARAEVGVPLADLLEKELLPSLSGLIRRAEKGRR
jgi:excisionase family DNA binding protein